MKPAPPSTCLGTSENVAAAAPPVSMNFRRDKPLTPWDFITLLSLPGCAVSCLFPQPMQLFQSCLRHLETIPIGAAHFHDVPLRTRARLAQMKNFFVKIAVEGFLLVLFDVD